MKFLLDVEFKAEPVTIEVEADSLSEAWMNRYELAAEAVPQEWEIHPTSIERNERI